MEQLIELVAQSGLASASGRLGASHMVAILDMGKLRVDGKEGEGGQKF